MLRRFGIFAITFVVVIAGGIAFAQMGDYLPSADSGDAEVAALESDFFTTSTKAEVVGEEVIEKDSTTTTIKPEKQEEAPAKPEPVEEEKKTEVVPEEPKVDTDPPDLIITSPETRLRAIYSRRPAATTCSRRKKKSPKLVTISWSSPPTH